MSWYCIHEKTWAGNRGIPPETWCELNEDYDCENCRYKYSQEDYDGDCADDRYDRYRESSFDF